jgi:hypothetical protein
MSDEHEDLVNLATHPGWLRWKEHARKTCVGARVFAERIDKTARDKSLTSEERAVKIMALTDAKDEIMALIAWPDERVGLLEQARAREVEPVDFSRRGML